MKKGKRLKISKDVGCETLAPRNGLEPKSPARGILPIRRSRKCEQDKTKTLHITIVHTLKEKYCLLPFGVALLLAILL